MSEIKTDDPWSLIDTLEAEGITLRLKGREKAHVFVRPGQEQRYWDYWKPIIFERAGPLFAVLTGQAVRIDTPRPRPLCGKFKPKKKRRTKLNKTRGPHVAGPAYSTPNWTPIPRQTGHPVQRKLDSDSSANWTPVPGQIGHLK